MEVDLIIPKVPPLHEETIFWFEFLLRPNTLISHLRNPKADPSPIELITRFLSIVPENQNQNELNSPDVDALVKNEGLKISRKQLALKILALKTAAYLKWDLTFFENNLPIFKQIQLLSDLCSVTAGKIVNLPISLVQECEIGPDGSKHSLNFALTLYHRWVLRAQVLRGAQIRSNKPFIAVPGVQDQAAFTMRDDLFISSLEPFTQQSVDYLNQIIIDPEPFKVLIFESFIALDANSEDVQQKFDIVTVISKTELKTQVHFDLCQFYMYVKKYDLAKENVILCRENLIQLQKEYGKSSKFLYCSVDLEELSGYLMACGISNEPPNLLQRMNESVLFNFKDILQIFKEDNIKREIPMTQRQIIELDIEASCSINPELKELELKVVALNAIRHLLDSDNLLISDIYMQKYRAQSTKLLENLFEFGDEFYPHFSLADQIKLKEYLLGLLLDQGEFDLVKKFHRIVSIQEVEDLKKQKANDELKLTGIGKQVDWMACNSKSIEIGLLVRKLIICTTSKDVRASLVAIAVTNPPNPLYTMNPSWSVPQPLAATLELLPLGFFRDFSYVLIGKATEFRKKRDYGVARELLVALKNETHRNELADNPVVKKLRKFTIWEILLIQIIQTLEEWPRKTLDQKNLVRDCKNCFGALSTPEGTFPRLKVLEYCAAMLLNLNEWASIVVPDKRFPTLELSVAFAQAVLDMDKFKGSKKTNRDAWDLVLPMFLNQQNTRLRHNENPAMLYTFLKKLRDPLIISIILSLLAKLHNILKDESNVDLNAEYMLMWPNNINNSNMYNIKTVSESLNNLLNQALKLYPNNIAWIKLKADLEFVNGNNESAMKYYVTSLIAGSEYCTIHLQRPLLDDYIVRRMIKCSSNLGCYMQAAILCQFLDETDYGLAFKNVSEKTSNFSDAMDSYYSCIWDPTLLEFIVNWHSKKGEHKRRLQAISFMGQLELNANNNEEIKRESASVRKVRFLRSLAKQYML